MRKIKCYIIDDQEPASKLLEEYVSKIPQLEIVGVSHEPLEALAKIQEQTIDLLFLDINKGIMKFV